MTRSLADKRSVGHAGKEIKNKLNLCRDGADPLKNLANSAEKISALSAPEEMMRCVRIGNGFFIKVANKIANFPNSNFVST
jgi:hypothetical protein